jgi:hypothetical protein
MGFRNPVTAVAAAAVAAAVDTRPTPAAVGVVLDNTAYDVEGSNGAGVVWLGNGPAAGLLDSLRRTNFPGIGTFTTARWLRLTGGSTSAYAGTPPTITLLATDTTPPDRFGATTPVNRSGISIVADDISLRGAVNGITPDPDWVAPTLQNGWTDYNYVAGVASSFATPRYRKLSDGSVIVSAIVKGGTIGVGIPVWTFPPGYRCSVKPPPIPALGNNAVARVDMETDGRLSVVIGSAIWTAFLFVFFPDS